MNKILLCLLIGILLAGCGGGVKDEEINHELQQLEAAKFQAYQQRKLLTRLTHQNIVPLYQQFSDYTVVLANSSQRFCKSPEELGLMHVRMVWGKTLSAWMRTDALLFGPSVADQLDSTIYNQPAKKCVINALLRSDKSITIQQLKLWGIGVQGLAALEFLLFEREIKDKQMAENFQGKTGKRRCEYLQSASKLLSEQAQKVYYAWKPNQGNYAAAVTQAGLDSEVYTDASQPLKLLVKQMSRSIEKVYLRKLAVPLGKTEQSKPNAYELEAWRSGHSLASIQANIEGLWILFDGGLLDWLKQSGYHQIASKLEQNFSDIRQVKFSGNDSFLMIDQSPAELENLYQKIKLLAQTIQIDFATAMNVQLEFAGNEDL